MNNNGAMWYRKLKLSNILESNFNVILSFQMIFLVSNFLLREIKTKNDVDNVDNDNLARLILVASFCPLLSRLLNAYLFYKLISYSASRLIIRCAGEPNLEVISVFPDSGLCRRVHTCTSDNRCVNALRSPNVASSVTVFYSHPT